MVLILFMLMLCGCTGSPEAETPLSCDDMEAGLERDTCFGDMVLAMTASEADKVAGIGGQIQDGMVRQAAISRWVADHANEIPKETHARPEHTGAGTILEVSPHLFSTQSCPPTCWPRDIM